MRQVIFLYAGLGLLLSGAQFIVPSALAIAASALAMISGVIALTFFWLWRMRATPLALGMSISWLAVGALLLSWQPRLIHLLILPLFMCGAILHLLVIQGTLKLPRLSFLIVLALSFCAAYGLSLF